jgi:hypothetical protein
LAKHILKNGIFSKKLNLHREFTYVLLYLAWLGGECSLVGGLADVSGGGSMVWAGP